MKSYYIKVTTITPNHKKFSNFIKFMNNTILADYIIHKTLKVKKKKTVVTILKSPHVNKTAQEQFELLSVKHQFTLYSPLNFKLLILLKQIKNNIFSDLKLKIKFLVNCNLHVNILNLDYFKLDIITPKNKKIIDCAFNRNFFFLGCSWKNNIATSKYKKFIYFNLAGIKNFFPILDSYFENLKFR